MKRRPLKRRPLSRLPVTQIFATLDRMSPEQLDAFDAGLESWREKNRCAFEFPMWGRCKNRVSAVGNPLCGSCEKQHKPCRCGKPPISACSRAIGGLLCGAPVCKEHAAERPGYVYCLNCQDYVREPLRT